MNSPMTNKMKKRNIIVCVCMAVFLIYTAVVLAKESVVNHDFYTEYANNQQTSSLTVTANRGTIFDTNMNVLAQSASVWDIVISPSDIKAENKETVAKELSDLLGVDYNKVLSQVNQTNKYAIVKKGVEKVLTDKVRELKALNNYFFIAFIESTKRYYPNDELASNVIGFTNYENNGAFGLEAYYNDKLKGIDGKVVTATDAKGQTIPTTFEQTYDAVDGNSLVLTIDSVIQNYVEKALDSVEKEHNPAGGATAIVMDVQTGAILAMANTDSYNLNNPQELSSDRLVSWYENPIQVNGSGDAVLNASGQQIPITLSDDEMSAWKSTLQGIQWGNKAVGWTSEPGSVAKAITASAALEEGTATVNSHFYCTGAVKVANATMHCHKLTGHGDLDFVGAIVNSCNPAFIQIGLDLGAENFYNYFDMFGLTEPTGIDLPGEQQGVYYTADKLGIVELASEAFGQTFTVTPLQMLTAISAVANGGYLMQPYVVSEVLDNDNNVIETVQSQVKRQVISQETSDIMRDAMEKMVSANGGSTAYVKGYEIAGKSGTAQKGNQTRGYKVSSFTGFAPANDPKVAVIVTVDSPTAGAEYGSVVAGPALGEIFANTLPYLGIEPTYTQDDANAMETITPDVIGLDVESAKAQIISKGLQVEVVGTGESVLTQSPQKNMLISKQGKIIIYTSAGYEEQTVLVPNLIGLTLTEANKQLTDLGLNISFDGSGTNNMGLLVSEQSIPVGTTIDVASVVSVKYASTLSD